MDRPRLLTPARPTGMTRRSVLGLGAAAASSLLLPGCSRGRADEPAPAGSATFATGNEGGVYATFGTALSGLVSEVTGMELKPIITNGSVDNLMKVDSGKADLGFCTSDTALAAYEGTGMFDSGRLKFTALARRVRQLRPLRRPDGLDGVDARRSEGTRRSRSKTPLVVSVGPSTSGTRVVADLILDAAGIKVTKRYLTLEESVKQLKEKARARTRTGSTR